MSAKTVLVTTSTFSKEDAGPEAILTGAGLSVARNPFERRLTEDEVAGLLQEHAPAGMIAGLEPLSRKVLEGAASHLKVISRCGTGMDNVDLPAAAEIGIEVFNTPDAPSSAVAELAVGLMLSVLRRIAECSAAVKAGKWERLMGRLLGGKTVGVVGCGRIGAKTAKIVQGFGCRVLGCDPAGVRLGGVEEADLETLLKRSDIVTLHTVLNEGTRGMIDEARLGLMRPGAVLVNTSRGGLIDEDALHRALVDGRLAGAGIDAFESEPYAGPLRDLPNAVLTAHIGSAAKECRVLMEAEASRNLVEGLRAAGAL